MVWVYGYLVWRHAGGRRLEVRTKAQAFKCSGLCRSLKMAMQRPAHISKQVPWQMGATYNGQSIAAAYVGMESKATDHHWRKGKGKRRSMCGRTSAYEHRYTLGEVV